MNRTLLALSVCSFVAACGGAPTIHAASAPAPRAKVAHVVPVMIDADAYDAPAARDAFASSRVVGDYLVREITVAGKAPLQMTERVLTKDGATAVLEVSFKEGKALDTYRVRVEETAAGEQTTDVTKVVAGAEHAFGVPAYDALLARTVPAVDSNDGQIDSEPTSVQLAGKAMAATRTEYKVMIHGKAATMSVLESKSLGDMGGEIATADGKVLYRARIVEMGSAPVGTASR